MKEKKKKKKLRYQLPFFWTSRTHRTSAKLSLSILATFLSLLSKVETGFGISSNIPISQSAPSKYAESGGSSTIRSPSSSLGSKRNLQVFFFSTLSAMDEIATVYLKIV